MADAAHEDGVELRSVPAILLPLGREPVGIDGPDGDRDLLEQGRVVVRERRLQARDGDVGGRLDRLLDDSLDEGGIAPRDEHVLSDEGRGGPRKVRPERSQEGGELVRRGLVLDVLQAIDRQQADDPAGESPRRFQDDGPAHRMPDQHHAIEVEGLHHGTHVLTESFHRPGLAAPPGFAVAGEVESHHPVIAGEPRRRVVPEMPIAAPAVDEHDRRRPLAPHLVADGDAVGRRDEGRDGRAREPHREQEGQAHAPFPAGRSRFRSWICPAW